MSTLLHFIRLAVFVGGISLTASAPAIGSPILVDTWYEFGFTDVGVAATGCDPADPAGAFCFPSSGTPTEFLGAAPWTFDGSAQLTVTDAFLSGDQFEILDFGAPIGMTSVPGAFTDCGDDPVVCLADAAMSHGVFLLGGGSHSLTIVPLASLGGGAGYLTITATVPEPGIILLMTSGISWFGARRMRLRRREHQASPSSSNQLT